MKQIGFKADDDSQERAEKIRDAMEKVTPAGFTLSQVYRKALTLGLKILENTWELEVELAGLEKTPPKKKRYKKFSPKLAKELAELTKECKRKGWIK